MLGATIELAQTDDMLLILMRLKILSYARQSAKKIRKRDIDRDRERKSEK